METAEAVVMAAWGAVALKVVLTHAAEGTDEHRQRRERVFSFISGKQDVTWAEAARNKKNAERGYKCARLRIS